MEPPRFSRVWLPAAAIPHRQEQIKPCKLEGTLKLTETSCHTGKPFSLEASYSSTGPVPDGSIIQGHESLPGLSEQMLGQTPT